MTLEFLNPSRSFDEVRRFLGHDGMFEVPIYIEVKALTKSTSTSELRSIEVSEENYLSTFDATRSSIHDVAREVYSHRRLTSYALTVADFR